MRIALALLLAFPALAQNRQEEPPRVSFNRDVRPILSQYCFACHGPDRRDADSELRLDTREGALSAIVPGKPAESELIRKISKGAMPPKKTGKKLDARQLRTLRAWIEQGAEYEAPWALTTPRKPALPEVRDRAWARRPLDRFILARLEKEGLRPSPEADRALLLRRLSFDLTGLPPTIDEVDAQEEYGQAVDRLLASPRYGERMAVEWLDAARYADTHGLHVDSHRDMSLWRDGVIRAFNDNQPFDRFTVEQPTSSTG
jgi:mono/diheme cytochrome c family protein